MTTTKRLKNGLVDLLELRKPDSGITVLDAQSFDETQLPCLVVDVPSVTNYSEKLMDVQRITVEITLCIHSGDDTSSAEDWIEAVEVLIRDRSFMEQVAGEGLKVYHWNYQGSSQEWSGEVQYTRFQAEVLAARF